MRIALDASPLRYRKTGIENYVYYLLKAMSEINTDDEFLLVNNSFRKGNPALLNLPPLKNPGGFQEKNPRVSKKLLRALWGFWPYPRIESFIGKIDVYHCPGIDEIPSTKALKVITIHDIYHRKGDFNPPDFTSELMEFFPRQVARADVIIAHSKNTRKDLIEELGADPEKIVCVYSAAGENMKRVTDSAAIEKVKQKLGIGREYMLFLGALGNVKNVVRIIEAYNILCEKNSDVPQLVLAGGKGYGHEKAFAAAAESPFASDIILPGYVDDADAPALMSGALFFVFPSLYEGFGIPVLEAMACGAPVLTSNAASIPEVAGDAALMVDPCNTEEIAHSMEKLMESQSLRTELREKGFERNKLFTWKKCAEETMQTYRSQFP